MIKGIARVIYYKYFLHVKWQPWFNPLSQIYSISYKGIAIKFRSCPFYDFEYDDLDYLKYINLSRPLVLVDAGSFIGTLAIFLAKLSPQSQIYALEPDPNNYRELLANIKLNRLHNVHPFQMGIYNKNGQVKFASGNGEMSQVSLKGDTVKVITLDKLSQQIKLPITHVKMDIEGAEIEAVQGAKNLIKKCHPKFIIASYHKRDGKPTFIFLEKFFHKYYRHVKTEGEKEKQTLTICS